MLIRSSIPALLAALLAWPAGAADESLGSFRDWRAMRFGEGNGIACMAFSRPVKSEGDYGKRGEAFVFVTHRPGSGERGAVSLETGYPFDPGSTVKVTIGGLTLALRTKGSTAWLDDAEQARRLVAAMRAGREMVVEGTSSRGTATVDRYSLYGFSAAHDAIGEGCPVS